MPDLSAEYDRIMEPIVAGDVSALEHMAESELGFPNGQDPWLHRYWLTNAIDCGNLNVIRWMLEYGAATAYKDEEGFTCLHAALDRQDADKYEAMRLLIEFGADVNAHGVNDWTPAHHAAARNDVEALRILHAAGADFSAKTRIDHYSTPLGEARRLGCSPEAVAYLRSIGAEDVAS